jgi:hypothetical protein
VPTSVDRLHPAATLVVLVGPDRAGRVGDLGQLTGWRVLVGGGRRGALGARVRDLRGGVAAGVADRGRRRVTGRRVDRDAVIFVPGLRAPPLVPGDREDLVGGAVSSVIDVRGLAVEHPVRDDDRLVTQGALGEVGRGRRLGLAGAVVSGVGEQPAAIWTLFLLLPATQV